MLQWHSAGENEIPASLDWLSPRERDRERRMRFAKRRNDFLLGRWNAKAALALCLNLGPGSTLAALARLEIGNAPDGAPDPRVDGAPAARSISMTDRAGWAVCLTGPPGRDLGCDLELVEPRSERFVRDYMTAPEVAFVLAEPAGQERDLAANLFWSAKESALKVLRTGLRRDTRSVEVVLGSTVTDGWRDMVVTADGEREFPGWWQRFGDFVLTIAMDADAGPPPTALVEPPGLASAFPTHNWMQQPIVSTSPIARPGNPAR